MEPQQPQSVSPVPPAPSPINDSPISRFKNISKKKKLLIIISLILFLLVIIIAAMMMRQKDGNGIPQIFKGARIQTDNLPDDVAAIVGETKIPKSYLEYELKYYPATPSAEAKKMLTEKLIDDQITLEKAQKENIIPNYPNSENMSKQEYLERTKLVQEVKDKVNEKGNIIRGKMVMVWFYNNLHIGPKGFEGSKKMAFDKINPFYQQVKNEELTIDQVGLILKRDKSIAEIDPVWESNAIVPFVYYQNGTATHWPEFNKLLWETEPGKITPLHLGGGILRDGKPVDELYIFAQIDHKSTGSSYGDYQEWLDQKRKEYNGNYSSLNIFFKKLIPSQAFAQDDGGNSGGGDNGSNQSSNDNNSDNGNNNNNGSRSGRYSGRITTHTGAPLAGARVEIKNSATTKVLTTDANGYYDTGVDYMLSCLNNPQYFSVTYNGQVCAQKTIIMGNGDVSLTENASCGPPPPPPPPPLPPINRCNQACETDTYCSDAEDGCTRCLPNAGGTGKTCQKPPPPVQCNDACVDDAFCANQSAGCTRCLPSATNPAQRTCQGAPSCGNLCVTPADCNGAKNGCTSCLPDQANPTRSICQTNPTCGSACATSDYCATADNGCTACIQGTSGAKCGTCPAGMTYNPATKSCACPNPNETNPHKVCDGDKCLDVASCGVSTCDGDKACFAEEMCKCDGFDSVKLEYPSSNPFVFEAFAKVEGTDMTKAGVEGMSFAMYEADKNNPNVANIIAQSPIYKPEIVSSTGSKVRYKASWSLTAPQIKAGKLYRVQAKIKCVPKKKSTLSELPTNQYQSKILGVKSANAQEKTPVPTPDYLQLTTLNFIRKVQGEQCHSMYFEMAEGIGTGQ